MLTLNRFKSLAVHYREYMTMHNQLGGIQTAVLGATLLLGGCVTPLHTEEKSLCHQDANQPQSQQCHYYSNQTPIFAINPMMRS